MSEYIFQKETMTGLADSFRYKLKNADSLSIEDMRKLVYLMHYDLDNGVTLYNYYNEPIYSYSIAEANKLAELPSDTDAPAGYIFANWSYTIDEINNTTIPLVVTAVYDELISQFKYVTSDANTSVSISITNNSTGNITVDWGDGSVENPSIANTATSEITHTYSAAGEYVVSVSSDDVYLRLKSNNKQLTRVRLGKHIDIIDYSSFRDCTGLTSIVIPDSVTSIGKYAFYNCNGLTSIEIPDSVTSIGSYAFSGCSGLTSAVIGDGVTSISNSAFKNCTGLTSVIIPNSVTSIGPSAFSGCSRLTSITIPDSVTSIGESAFSGCSGLTSAVIGDGVTSINYYAFKNCTGLTSVEIFGNVRGKYMLDGCSSLTSVKVYRIDDPDITKHTFDNCFCNLFGASPNATMTKCGTRIGSSTMYYYLPNNLTDVTVLGGVLYNSAFYGCTMIKNVTLADDVVCASSIPNSVFVNCSALQTVTLGRGITAIGNTWFHSCPNLQQVTLSNSVTSIGDSAFHSYTGEIIFQGTRDQWNSISKNKYWNYKGSATVTCTG